MLRRQIVLPPESSVTRPGLRPHHQPPEHSACPYSASRTSYGCPIALEIFYTYTMVTDIPLPPRCVNVFLVWSPTIYGVLPQVYTKTIHPAPPVFVQYLQSVTITRDSGSASGGPSLYS